MNRKETIAVISLLVFLPACMLFADGQEVFDRAGVLLQQQRYADALKAYEIFIHDNPGHHLVPAAKWAMGNIYFTVDEDYSRAAIIFQNIISKHPGTGWEVFSYDRLGMCYEKQEKWSDAARVYELALAGLNAEAQRVLAQDWNGIFKARLLAAYRTLDDRESMIRILAASLNENPAGSSAPDDQFNLAQVHLEMGAAKKAADNLAMVVDRYPFSNAARRVQNEYTDLLATELAYDWAPFETFQSSVRLSQTGRYDEALEGFDKVIAEKSNTGMELAARFQKELVEFRKNGDARGLHEKLTGGQEEYPYGFGGVRSEQFLEVLERIIEAESSISAESQDIGAYGTMAFAYYQLQAYYPGIETYKKAIAMEPDNTGFYNMLGYCHIGVEAYDDAIASFRDLIDIAPDDPNSYDSMAEAYYVKGDTSMAIRFYEQSLAIDSSFTNPYYMLGEIHTGTGQNDEARKYLERYLELDPEGFRAQAAQQLLTQLTQERE